MVVHQLPITPDTLWLRLLGKGGIQTNAIKEVLAMPQGDTLRNDALQLLSNWKIIEKISTQQEQKDREALLGFWCKMYTVLPFEDLRNGF